MSRVVFIEERCKGCLLCTTVCPKDIIRKSQRFNRQGYQVAEAGDNAAECTGCGSCGLICPDVAIRVFRTPRKAARPAQVPSPQAEPASAASPNAQGAKA